MKKKFKNPCILLMACRLIAGPFFGLRDLLMHLREAPNKEMNIPKPRFLLREQKDKFVFTTLERIFKFEY